MTVRPDGGHVYVAAFNDDTVAVSQIHLFSDGVESGDTTAWTRTVA